MYLPLKYCCKVMKILLPCTFFTTFVEILCLKTHTLVDIKRSYLHLRGKTSFSP